MKCKHKVIMTNPNFLEEKYITFSLTSCFNCCLISSAAKIKFFKSPPHLIYCPNEAGIALRTNYLITI